MRAVIIREAKARLSDPRAERLWRLSGELRDGLSLAFETPEMAVAYLSGKRTRRPESRRRSDATRRRPPPS